MGGFGRGGWAFVLWGVGDERAGKEGSISGLEKQKWWFCGVKILGGEEEGGFCESFFYEGGGRGGFQDNDSADLWGFNEEFSDTITYTVEIYNCLCGAFTPDGEIGLGMSSLSYQDW